MAFSFLLATAWAADPAPLPSPIGLNVDQVIARYGEPKSQIAAGNRVMMFFAREKLVLRDGIVIEVERLPSEPMRRSTPAPSVPVVTATTPPDAASTGTPATADRAAAAGTVAAPAPMVVAPAAAPTVATSEAVSPTLPPQPEPKLEIKSVRRPSSKYTPPATTKQDAPAPSTAATTPTPPTKADAVTPPTAPATSKTTSTPDAPIATAATVTPMPTPSRNSSEATTSTPPPEDPAEAAKAAEEARAEEAAAAAALAKAEKEKKVKIAKARRRLNDAGTADDEADISEAFLTTRTFVISAFVIGGGIAFLYWRSRQRQLALAVTAVSRTPFSAPTAATVGGGAVFNSELLAKLEWKRFEELVVAYYVKTGVVAARTKTGPTSPVHIKISWKGEPRPFACVQCIAHPQGLLDAKPLQDLFTVLAAEDIRRGYVVTSGKFNVNARDYAEEKHLTLLPGDIFLEKLNALPDAARNEIMQAITTGDYQTPSCPKCDAKMVRSTDDPPTWKCALHADQVIPVWR